MYEFDVVIIEDETGGYIALVPALPGCHTQGDTLEGLMKNIKEAIELYMETLTGEEKKDLLRQRVVGIQKVKEHYGDGQKFGVKIKYIQQDKPKGIATPSGFARNT